MRRCLDCDRPMVPSDHKGPAPEGWVRSGARGLCITDYSRSRDNGTLPPRLGTRAKTEPLPPLRRQCSECKRPMVASRWKGLVPDGWARYGGLGLCGGCNWRRRRTEQSATPTPEKTAAPPDPSTVAALDAWLAGRNRRLDAQRRRRRLEASR